MTADWPAPTGQDDAGPATTTFAAEQPTEQPTVSRTRLPVWALIPIAALVWWVVGFLPWILNGLSSGVSDQVDAGRTAVPLFTGNVSGLVVGSGIGGLLAGLVALLGRGQWFLRAVAVAAGVAIAVFAALLQSRRVLQGTDGRVLDGLTGVVVAMTVVALVVGLLCLAGRAGLGIALAGVAGAAPLWLANVLQAAGAGGPGSYEGVDLVARWVGAAVLAVALVSIGVRPLVRLVGWPIAVILAWLVAPTVTAAGYMEQLLRPGMGFAERIGENVSASLQVWQMAAQPDARPLTPWIAAVIVAGLVAGALAWRASTTSGAEQPAP